MIFIYSHLSSKLLKTLVKILSKILASKHKYRVFLHKSDEIENGNTTPMNKEKNKLCNPNLSSGNWCWTTKKLQGLNRHFIHFTFVFLDGDMVFLVHDNNRHSTSQSL